MNKIVWIALVLLLTVSLKNQASPFNMGERIKIHSTVLSQDRELQVLLPENYYANASSSYPVIYLLDGDYNFHGVSGMLDLLANKGQLIPNVILVAIADKGTSQYRQFMTPSDLTFNKTSKGQATQFLAFLEKELKPYIANNYRAAKHSTLVGQSMGGLFVVNALIEKPELFNNYVAISPSIWVDDQGVVANAQERLGKAPHDPVNLFLSLADETRMGVYDFINVLDINEPSNIDWSFKHYMDENHNSIGLIALRDSLKATYQDWYINEKQLAKFKDPKEIIEHYSKIMNELGFEQAIPTGSIRSMVRSFYRSNKPTELTDFIKLASIKLPASKQALILMQASYVGHFDSPKVAMTLLKSFEDDFSQSIEYVKTIAATYEQLNDKSLAQKYYKKALELARKQQANQWQVNIINARILASK